MIILTKENILSYIKEHVPSLQLKEPHIRRKNAHRRRHEVFL